MKAIIIAAGEDLPKKKRFLKELGKADCIVCADGGVDHLLGVGFLPDVILGDFDSAKIKERPNKDVRIIRYPVRKDQTDLELALDFVYEEGCTSCTVIGATGSRMDHSLVALFLIARFTKMGMAVTLVNRNNRVRYLQTGSYTVEKPSEDWYVSFIASEDCVLSLSGFDYNLEKTCLEKGSSLGISNHILDDVGNITVEGEVYMLFSRDEKGDD